MKKDNEEISMVLGMMPWKDFIAGNMILPRMSKYRLIDEYSKKIRDNVSKIKEFWIQNNHLRLGQVLIKMGILPDDPIMKSVDESKWMCKIAEVELV
jgi:hypothetical protein